VIARGALYVTQDERKRLGRPPIAPVLEKRIREALATPGRPGVRKIAARFGVNPGTVQRISCPFGLPRVVASSPSHSRTAAVLKSAFRTSYKDDWYCSARRVRPLVSGEHLARPFLRVYL
jgi:hypothetical protein